MRSPPHGHFLGIGLSLHAVGDFIECVRPLIEEEADYFEVAPETLWIPGSDPARGNGYLDLFAELKRRSGRPFTAHALEGSLGGALSTPEELARKRRWLDGLAATHAVLDFEWFSDHLGWCGAAGRHLVFPLPLPPTEEAAQRVAQRLLAIQRIIPCTAIENPAGFFRFGAPTSDAGFWNRITALGSSHLILDLHNLYTESLNLNADPYRLLEQLDLNRVIQIHLSGGTESDPEWVEPAKSFRLDSHDSAIPEEVWSLLGVALDRCPNLRGLVIERLDGTIRTEEVPELREEMHRARRAFEQRNLAASTATPAQGLLAPGGNLDAVQRALALHLHDTDSFAAMLSCGETDGVQELLNTIDPAGYRMTSLIVRKLRFERLCLADSGFRRAFEADPDTTVAHFEAFARAVPPTAHCPLDDASAFHTWSSESTA